MNHILYFNDDSTDDLMAGASLILEGTLEDCTELMERTIARNEMFGLWTIEKEDKSTRPSQRELITRDTTRPGSPAALMMGDPFTCGQEPFNGQDQDELTSFEHRGMTYIADCAERIWNEDGTILGYICSRGNQFAWGAVDESVEEMEPGSLSGNGTRTGLEDHDPAMDALVGAQKG